jgi:hypothetical protein
MKDFEKMRAIAKDIIDMSDEIEEMLLPVKDRFHELMRKHGLCWGTRKGEHATTGANPEWTMAKDYFVANLEQAFHWVLLLDIPEDLMAYKEEEDE